MENKKKSIFESPILSSKIKSAKPKLFPEGALGYFIGPTLALFANSFLANYFNKYLTDILGITTWGNWAALFNTLLPVISVFFVVLGNVLIGRLMDKSKTKAGKARPLILLSLPFSVIALLILFVFKKYTNAESALQDQIIAAILIAVGYNLWFAVAYPLYFTPHSALVNLSTRDGKDRSLLATFSNACNLAAMGLCTMIIPMFLNLFFVYDMTGGPGTIPIIDEVTGQIKYYTDTNGGIIYDGQASSTTWMIFVVVLAILTAVGVILEYYFTKERVTEESFVQTENQPEQKEEKKTITIKEQFQICKKDKFWIIIMVFFFLYQFGGMIKNVSQLYYATAWFQDDLGNYTADIGGKFSGTLAIIGAIPTAIGMLIAWPLSNKIGKAKAMLLGAGVAFIGGAVGLLVPFVKGNTAIMVITSISFAIKALGSTPSMYLSIALLGDVLDHQEALYGKRTDGLSMTIYGAILAGMTGIVTGILNGVLSAFNYSPSNPEAVQIPIMFIFVGGETLCYLAILILFIFMKVEKFSKFDHIAIEEDKKAVCDKNGTEYIPSEVRLQLEEEKSNQEREKNRIEELKAQCLKKGLNFEEEEAKYQAKLAEKVKKQEEKERLKEEKKAQLLAKLSKEDLQARELKEKQIAQKQQEIEKVVGEEFALLREKTKEERCANLGL